MKYLIFTILSIFSICHLNAQNPSIVLTTFASGFTNPLGIENCGDSRLFIVEQGGKVYIVDSNGVKNPTPFLNISFEVNSSGNEQGLLGLAFHPDYKNNGYIYVNYIHGSGNGYTRISRFTRDPNNPNHIDSSTEQILLTFAQPYNNHNGGCIRFGPDGYLYDCQGDGGNGGDPGNRAQQKDTILGKILRIDVDHGNPYSIPADNPFVNGGGRPEVWAYGVRNPWRYSFDRLTGDLWIGDVGQNLYEEVDFQPAHDTGGINYGWHCYEATHTYSPGDCNGHNGLTDPIYEYSHTNGGCSITGGFVYRGTQYANMFGKYFFTDFCGGHIESLQVNNSGGYTHVDYGQYDTNNYTSFGEDANGELYLAERVKGIIVRMRDTACKPVAYIAANDTILTCSSSPALLQALNGKGLSYQWRINGNDIAGATSSVYGADSEGIYTVYVTNGKTCSNESDKKAVLFYPETTIDFNLPASGNYNTPTIPVYCDNNDFFVLSASPTGGIFTGKGVQNDTLFLSAYTDPGDSIFVSYTFTDNNRCSYLKRDTALLGICEGVKKLVAPALTLFPNPSTGSLNLSYYNPVASMATIKIINELGETSFTEEKHLSGGQNKIQFDLSSQTSGMYFIQLITPDGISRSRFLINR